MSTARPPKPIRYFLGADGTNYACMKDWQKLPSELGGLKPNDVGGRVLTGISCQLRDIDGESNIIARQMGSLLSD